MIACTLLKMLLHADPFGAHHHTMQSSKLGA
jgi:hypothetical protein